MGLIIYGNTQTPIGVDELFVRCPCCEAQNWADVMVLSNYYHIYWIPIFPFEKNADIICKKCGLKRYGIPFTPSLISNFMEVKGNFRHPWFTYLGAGIFSIIVIAIVIAANIK